jgi:hypothetical protein
MSFGEKDYSFQEIRQMLADLTVKQAENAAQQKKTDEQMRKTDEQMKQTDERLSAKLEKLSKELGNIGNNNGEVAEEFFWNALREVKEFKGIKVDYSDRNIHRKRGNLNDEFDILLWNGNSVIIVETKYKVHPSLIEKIKEKKIPNFKKLFSDKIDHKIYYAIAGFVIPESVLEDAKREGFFVIRQFADSENIIIENSEVKSF